MHSYHWMRLLLLQRKTLPIYNNLVWCISIAIWASVTKFHNIYYPQNLLGLMDLSYSLFFQFLVNRITFISHTYTVEVPSMFFRRRSPKIIINLESNPLRLTSCLYLALHSIVIVNKYKDIFISSSAVPVEFIVYIWIGM